MSWMIRSLLYNKVATSLQSIDEITARNIINHLSLKVNDATGLYTFSFPLKARQYNIQSEAKNIALNKRDDVIDNVRIENDNVIFDLTRKAYVTSVLESNYHNVGCPTFLDENKNIIVEYSSPNIAKPFHLGHLRSTILGNFVANINSFVNNNVKRINYLGDWGTQYGFIQMGIEKDNIDVEQIKKDPIGILYRAYVSANKHAESDPSIADKAREIFTRLEEGTSKAQTEWESIRIYTVDKLKEIYNRLGVTFDEYHWESMYSAKNVNQMIACLEEMQLLKSDSENRKVIHLDNGKIVPMVKSDGSTLYMTRDVAAAIDRFEKNSFDIMYYVVDNSQAQHFVNLKEILQKMDIPWYDRLQHIKFGRITGMSTRKGTAIFLDDILNEMRDVMQERQQRSVTTKVPLGVNHESVDVLATSAVIINDLKQRRQRDYSFDINAAFDVKGDTGVKLQYCHCRLVSLEENSSAVLVRECDPTLLVEPDAQHLLTQIGKFEEAVLKSYQTLEPCTLVVYLFHLSRAINKAFKTLPIKNQPSDIASQRLLLFHTAKNILAQGMKLVGITPLNKM